MTIRTPIGSLDLWHLGHPGIDEFVQICRRHRLLSPRSAAALAKLKRGQTNLARSELNAISNLIERLRDVGVDLTEIAGAE